MIFFTKKTNKNRFISLLLTLSLVVMMAVPVTSIAAQQLPVDLGTAYNFAVLAGSTVTNTGSSVINGDIGLSPGTSVTGFPPGTVTGTIYENDAVASQAQLDLTDAYLDVAGRDATDTVDGDLGGEILGPGVYKSESSLAITGTLTLDGEGDPNAIFIFQMGTTLTTETGSIVDLINGAQPYNVFWQVGSSATLGTSSDFKGNILALESITATTSVTVDGRLLAGNHAVTLDTNTITITMPATLHVIKHVINDNGGTAVAADFNVHVKTSDGSEVYGSPSPGAESPGTTYILPAGAYVVSEDVFVGYTGSFSGDSTDGNIDLVSGDEKTITITNNDLPIPQISVIKTPDPLALTGTGLVTYTYAVTNPGTVALSNVSVTDDKISSVTYVSGDINTDTLLQPDETWIYSGTMTLTETTTNTATAQGSANNMTATDIAFATVVVTQQESAPYTPYTPVYPPLINVIKIPNPLALTGQGMVTYTYTVTNPGMVALSNVSVTDDKISAVNYVSGDVNEDNLLQPNETWIYSGTMTLTETTTNTATAQGSANNMTATDIAFATVVVTPPEVAPVYPPLINVIKTPNPLALTGTGLVTYTYTVTNPGVVALSNVSVTDDKISAVNYVSGDVNADNLLQPGETWIYTGAVTLTETTTNTATAQGSANDMTATDIAFATVVVTQPVVAPVDVTSDTLPRTSGVGFILLGLGLLAASGGVLIRRKRK